MKTEPRHFREAPEELRDVFAFLNSEQDFGDAQSPWPDPGALGRWLVQSGLLPVAVELDVADLERARVARRALRALFAVGQGRALSHQYRDDLERLTERVSCRIRFGVDTIGRPEPATLDLDGVLGRLFALVTIAQSREDWGRYKVCIASDCGRVFYDASINRRGRWCSKQCGDRINAREHRRKYKKSHGKMPKGGSSGRFLRDAGT